MDARVLLVDDEAPFVQALSRRLDKRGYVVLTASDGLEALDSLEKNPNIDVVVLDVKMPGMDGLEALKAIKKKYPLVEVIMLTGHATFESGVAGMKLGALDYMMKPCDLEMLGRRIDEAKTKKDARKQR